MIKLVNIDYRLIHGQIVFGWAKYLQIEHLIIIDDKTLSDKFTLSMLKLGVPADMDLSVIGQSQVKDIVNSKECIAKNTMIIIPDLIAALQFVKEIKTQYINVSNVKEKESSERFSNCCFLNNEEKQAVMEMINMGIKVDAFPTPGNATGINLTKVFERRMKQNR